MIKDQKISRSKAFRVVKTNIELLKNSVQTLKSVYKIIFSHPDFEFLEIVNNRGFDVVTYKQAQDCNNVFGHYFKDTIKNSKYVGIYLDNSKEWIYSFFGLLLAGFTPVLFSTANPVSEIEIIGKKLGISHVITNKTLDLPGISVINPFEIKCENKNENFDNEFGNEIILLTSGTSGTPKIVFYSGEEICNQIYNAKGILKGDKNIGKTYKGALKHLVILPFYHVFCLFAVLIWFAFLNRTFVLPQAINARAIKRACETTKPTHIFAVPAFWESIVAMINTKVDTEQKAKKLAKAFKFSYFLQDSFVSIGNYLVRHVIFKKHLDQIFGSSIQYCISGGAFISEDTLKTINLLGYRLINGYGATEIGITSLCNSNKIKHRLVSSIGKPFEFVEYKIENGALLVKSPSISKHIIDNEKEINIGDEFVNTNDIAKRGKGNYFLLGRADEIVIRNDGENLSIPLIEKQLSLPLANEFALVANNNEMILVASYDKNVSLENVIKELDNVGKTKAGAHVTSIYYTNKAFEKANSIKIKRSVLLKQLNENKKDFIAFKYLKDHTQEFKESIDNEFLDVVINAFKKVFPDKDITKTTNYYSELGGDSLRYFVLLSEIESKIGRGLCINPENPPLTPEDFVKEIEKE